MVNQSKINDPRFWKMWRECGAVRSVPDDSDSLESKALYVGDEPNLVTAYQVEVIVGPDKRTNEFFAQCREIAAQYGSNLSGNFDLTRERPDPNSFHLFYDRQSALDFRDEIFESGISNAVYVRCIGSNSSGGLKPLRTIIDEAVLSGIGANDAAGRMADHFQGYI